MGLIIFKRNIDTPDRCAAWWEHFRDAVGSDAPVLVDQEGGRVQRLGRRIGRSIRRVRSIGGSTSAMPRPGWRRHGSARG